MTTVAVAIEALAEAASNSSKNSSRSGPQISSSGPISAGSGARIAAAAHPQADSSSYKHRTRGGGV